MEIEEKELIFKRASDIEALSSFNCGVREIDFLIHKKENGLQDYIQDKEYDSFYVYYNDLLVAVFVFSDDTFKTEDGDYDATEIDFIAVKEGYRRNHIGTKIIDKISEISQQNNRPFLMVGAFFNKKYSAQQFYERCGF